MAVKNSTRQGLRFPVPDSDEKFLRFFDMVQDTASKDHKVFFLDCGQCREFEDEEMAGEDLSGWLIDESLVDEFRPEGLAGWNEIDDRFFEDFVWAKWSMPGGVLRIDFVKMQ